MGEKDKAGGVGCFGYAIIILVIMALFGSCLGNDDDSSKYSDSYRNDSEYRNNVNDIAEIFGESAEDVDRKINDVVDSINGKR